MFKKIIFVIIPTVLLFSCSSTETKVEKVSEEKVENTEPEKIQGENVTLIGKVKNGGHATLILEANTDRGSVLISKTVTNEDGEFNFQGAIKDMGLYQLRLDEGTQPSPNPKTIPLTLVPKDEVHLDLDFDDFSYSVEYEGTRWAAGLTGYMKEMQKFIEWQKSIKNPQEIPQEKIIEMVLKQKEPMDRFIIEEIRKDPSNPAHILLMTNLMPMVGFEHFDPNNIELLKFIEESYKEEYPDNPMTKNIEKQVNELEKGWKEYETYVVKNEAPDISLPSPNGEVLSLSSLRGNYVLIDFWASWCAPCRVENPNVVRLYHKYKDKNFEIFSVSLDDNKNAWMEAIQNDGLIWKNHVSDLKKWNTPLVQTYQFNGIPHTVFIGPDGKIIAKNLRGVSLERKLQEVFGS